MQSQDSHLQLASDLRTVVSRMIKKLRSKSSVSEKLSLTERSVLRLLDEHKDLLPGEMAAKEKITAQSMSAILNHLSEAGFIIRKISETDKRKVLISLSKRGLNLLHKTRHERDEWLGTAISKTLTAREQEVLRKAIGPLSKINDFD